LWQSGIAKKSTDAYRIHADLIRDGVDGLLVPARDPEALARLVADPGLRGRLGEAAAKRVREDYGAGRMAREDEEAYGRMMGKVG